MVIQGVHKNKGITLVSFKNENISVGVEQMKGHKFILREVNFRELGFLKNATKFLAKIF